MHSPLPPGVAGRRVFIHVPRCGGRSVELWLSRNNCAESEPASYAHEMHQLHAYVLARGVGYSTMATSSGADSIELDRCARTDSSRFGPLFNCFLVRGSDGLLRSVWTCHSCASTFAEEEMFALTRTPYEQFRSALEYTLSFMATDAAVFSVLPWRWRSGGALIRFRALLGVLEICLFRVVVAALQVLEMLCGRRASWLFFELALLVTPLYRHVLRHLLFCSQAHFLSYTSADGQARLVGRRYDLATSHRRCLRDLATWLAIPAPREDVVTNRRVAYTLCPKLRPCSRRQFERMRCLFHADYEALADTYAHPSYSDGMVLAEAYCAASGERTISV